MRPRHFYFSPVFLSLLCALAACAEEPNHHAEILRRLANWEKPQTTFTAPAPINSEHSRGFALCIGLNRLDPNGYGGWDGALTGCENDANQLADLARDRGFQVKMLVNEQATRAAVRAEVLRLASICVSGDLVMIGFAGHGGQVPDFNGDEEDGFDESWCLFDGQVIDDEMMTFMTRFSPGVRVLVITDSCHAGSSFKKRVIELRHAAKDSSHQQIGDKRFQERLNQLQDETDPRRANAPSAVRAMPPAFRELIRSDPGLLAEYEEYGRNLPKPAESERIIEAAVIYIGGCQEDQLAIDGPTNGLFTGTLKDLYAQGKLSGKSYRRLHRVVSEAMPIYQQPTIFAVGKDTARFLNQPPFERKAR